MDLTLLNANPPASKGPVGHPRTLVVPRTVWVSRMLRKLGVRFFRINDFPNELLVLIFEFVVIDCAIDRPYDPYYWLPLTAVCTRWRELAL